MRALEQTATNERLAWLRGNDSQLHDTAQECIVAYGLLADMCLSWHIDQMNRRKEMSDEMPVDKFGKTRKRPLIEAYQTIEVKRLRIRTQFRFCL